MALAASVQVDVRVIAATNRNLEVSVANGPLRSGLFYRLNVFPIEVPPLRERKDDLLILLEYFIHRYAGKAGKNFGRIDKQTLELFRSYDWPGNIRELQNVVERSVILSSDDVFCVDESWLVRTPKDARSRPTVSNCSEVELSHERQIIEATLGETRGRISGPNGAAARLQIPASTLDDRTFWKYGNNLFEQVFCMRQLYQMDKVAAGRFKLHNLYAILPSYGYSWDRVHTETAPSGDPTHLSDGQIAAGAWFYKLVSLFPLMYLCLFVSALLFAGEMVDINSGNKFEIYGRVAVGASFIFFLWLARSMRSCEKVMQMAFRAKRIGVESPWPLFPQKNVDDATFMLHRRRNGIFITIAWCLSLFSVTLFLGWALPRFPSIAGHVPTFLVTFAGHAGYWRWAGAASIFVFFLWGFTKERRIRGVLSAARRVWPPPAQVVEAVRSSWVPLFLEVPSRRLKRIFRMLLD